MYVSVVLFVKEVVEFKLGGFEKIYKRKLEAEFNFQVERERERVRKPNMFFIRILLKEYWNLGKAGKKKKNFA